MIRYWLVTIHSLDNVVKAKNQKNENTFHTEDDNIFPQFLKMRFENFEKLPCKSRGLKSATSFFIVKKIELIAVK